MNPMKRVCRNGSRAVKSAVVFSLAIGLAMTIQVPARAGYQVIHTFTGGSTDGAQPYGSLLQSGSTLYGTTRDGGSANLGTIFQVGADGSGFSILHSFTGGSTDGSNPVSDLIRSGSTLYGTTYDGGSSTSPPNTGGTIFRVNADGTGFSLLHSFTGTDGYDVSGSLIQSGSSLYGMARFGGSAAGGAGTIYKLNTDGTGFTVLHSFAAGSSDGDDPMGSLILSGSTLYGMAAGTNVGPGINGGTIFKMGADGTGFTVLHSFTGGNSDGFDPRGSLIQSDSTLYGMTKDGGTDDLGTVFKIGADGSGFSLLHSFTNGPVGGGYPVGSLLQSGSTLYGMAAYRGVFQIGTDGTGYSDLHHFGQVSSDGNLPVASLIQSGSTLYGTTELGGDPYLGTIFSITVPEPSTVTLFGLGTIGLLGYAWRARKRKALVQIG